MNSRLPPLGLTSLPVVTGDPVQCRALDRQDIDNIRRWHMAAAKRARHRRLRHRLCLCEPPLPAAHFLDPALNQRRDEYGGSVQNRLRIVKELLQEVRDARGRQSGGRRCAGRRMAMTTRSHPEWQLEMVGDAWMACRTSGMSRSTITRVEMGTSRAGQGRRARGEGPRQIRDIVTGPIVTVGRYTSPESMLRLVKSGVADFIGAARPSIADPFLPNKITRGPLRRHPRMHRLQHLLCA